MLRSLKTLAATSLLTMLVACGGAGDPDIGKATTGGSTQTLPTVWTSEGRYYNSCSTSPGCSGNPYAPFTSYVTMAPANGATLNGIVRLEVRGIDMANVELLPASGYSPRYGVFNITGDKTVAWLDLDTTTLPNGPVTVRISAFDVPAGQPGAREIVAMPARTWSINNSSAPASGPFTATVTSAPADGAVVSGTTRLEIRGNAIANAELLPATGYTPRLGVFNVSEDRTYAWLDFDSRSLPDGVREVRISAYNVMQGQPNASEIVAMAPRRWQLSNGAPGSFAASVTMAPPNGALVSGTTLLEVRGSGLENVELLPSNGYLPRLGVFTISYDKTYAYLYFDSTQLPNGTLDARISAFNVPAGQPNAREIVAMPARRWELRH